MVLLREETVGKCKVTFKGAWISEKDFGKMAKRVVPILEALGKGPLTGNCRERRRWTAPELTVWVFDRFKERKAGQIGLAEDCDALGEKAGIANLAQCIFADMKQIVDDGSAMCIVDPTDSRPIIVISTRSTDFMIFHELTHHIMTRDMIAPARLSVVVGGADLSPGLGPVIARIYGAIRDLTTFRLAVGYPEYARMRVGEWKRLFNERYRRAESTRAGSRRTFPILFHKDFCIGYAMAVLAHRLGHGQEAGRMLKELEHMQEAAVLPKWCGTDEAKDQFRSDVQDWYDAFDRMFDDESDIRTLAKRYIVPLLERPQQYCKEEGTLVDVEIG